MPDPVPVLMPQMGESIAEGTVVRWIKQVGDAVDKDEPLFEISTDKVDAEIPSPAAGVLAEIRVKEGETVAVNSVVATIGDPTRPNLTQADGTRADLTEPDAARPSPPQPDATRRQPDQPGTNLTQPVGTRRNLTQPDVAGSGVAEPDAARRARSSPLVRRIAKEHGIDIGSIPGTGVGGRVTKQDILTFLDRRPAGERPSGAGPAPPVFRPGESVEVVPLGVMRRKIAEHMVLSKKTSAHVHSVFEVDFSHVARLRAARKATYERDGVKLTYLTFIAHAVAQALRAFPILNSSLDGENIVYRKDVNLGVAVALDWGLIVPVVPNADRLGLADLGRAIADLAARARAKQLKPEEVQRGTFTITNPGIFGAMFGMPIINQPQVAILGIGAIEKRTVVVDDAIAIRPTGYLTLGFDHRIVDGAVADQFLSHVREGLQRFDERLV